MYINQIYKLSMVLDNKKFHEISYRACDRPGRLEGDEGTYIDQSLGQKGITVIYRDSQYKKKVQIIIDLNTALRNGSDVEHSIRKLDKWIGEYFGYRYRMSDFMLSGMVLATDIDVRTHDDVQAYLKVLRRIGKVKGFSPSSYDCFEEDESFCLDGNSNGIRFLIYDLGSLFERQLRKTDKGSRKRKSIVGEAQGILRTEVRLTKPKAVRAYISTADVREQIVELSKNCGNIFMDTFGHIIPFGDFYKKDKAMEIIRKDVKDDILRRKMLRLLALIPEKKSLYLAQKAMNCRDTEKVLDAFAKINLSPVTISKRQEQKYLECLYFNMLEKV